MRFLPDRSPAFDAFVAPARAWPALWRLVLGCLLAVTLWLTSAAVLLWLAARIAGPEDGRVLLLTYLGAFAALIGGLGLAARLFQRRGLVSLIGPAGFRPRHFALGVAAIAALALPSALLLDAPARRLELGAWAAWLPLAVPALMIQISAEEMAFRGYLTQGLAARFASRAVWWLLPAVIFGLMHWNPVTFGPNAWLVVLSAALIGLILGDVTIRTGNLSLAMGLHFSNNAIALLLVAPPSPLSGLSLWLSGVDATDPAAFRRLLFLDIATTLFVYGLWLIACARRDRRA